MHTRAARIAQQRRLAAGLEADVRAEIARTAELVERLAGVTLPQVAGEHDRRSLAQMVRDSGYGSDDIAPVLRIDGKGYR